MDKINVVFLFMFAIVLIYTAHTLNVWNEEHLDPCCNQICGRTTSMEECHPKFVAGFMLFLGIIIMILGIYNLVKDVIVK